MKHLLFMSMFGVTDQYICWIKKRINEQDGKCYKQLPAKKQKLLLR